MPVIICMHRELMHKNKTFYCWYFCRKKSSPWWNNENVFCFLLCSNFKFALTCCYCQFLAAECLSEGLTLLSVSGSRKTVHIFSFVPVDFPICFASSLIFITPSFFSCTNNKSTMKQTKAFRLHVFITWLEYSNAKEKPERLIIVMCF